ncbi:DegT/DnrJ/EryC1/StrS family aminotransferase [Salibacterium halotolerans]|uniref:dTDP-4-amino-4,6-dideoxygalactose transaminase n=1 Tax=Salibacterium halotolerans TaxID=1884432 RepID=A0A1I5XVV9_9BACI|nr:DegT/DnrJ/EryC1/StrS family aminotransferase [Salibacterium halotolerans]SFQ36046.1 dTDP-4-amino-4,6-dideoxygalactose transaminase [Salibacterium halotolerans]
MNVPMLDLTEQYDALKSEIHNKLEEVMTSSQFILGPNVKILEQSLAAYSNAEDGIGVASGSDALHLSLLAAGVEEGDEVILPAFTFFATAGAVARIGAVPKFVDIEPEGYNIDPDEIEEVISVRTKAIIPVHLYGQTADMDSILKTASKYNIAVIEDAAQAIGAEYKGKKSGEFGDTCCFSFFPTKNLGAYGDAGMVVTNNDDLAEKIKVLRVHGSKPKYHHHVLGYNSRLDEIQAAVLNVKNKYLETWNDKRQEKAAIYDELLKEYNILEVIPPKVFGDRRHVFHQYTIRAEQRDDLQTYLKEQGVSSMIYYPIPLHLQPVFSDLGYEEGDLPVTEQACKEVLSLPMFPELTEEQQRYVIHQISNFYKNN